MQDGILETRPAAGAAAEEGAEEEADHIQKSNDPRAQGWEKRGKNPRVTTYEAVTGASRRTDTTTPVANSRTKPWLIRAYSG